MEVSQSVPELVAAAQANADMHSKHTGNPLFSSLI